jgi:hypothetical protein
VEDVMLRLAASELRIQRGRLGAVADEQDAVVIGFIDTRGPVRAVMVEPRNAAKGDEENENTNNPAHGVEHAMRCHAWQQNGPALQWRGRVGFSKLRFWRYYLPKPKLKLTPLRGRPKEGWQLLNPG